MDDAERMEEMLNRLWEKACAYEDHPPYCAVIRFSDENPYGRQYYKLYKKMKRQVA